MLPILFQIGSVTFYTFGLFLGVGFFISGFTIWRRLSELGLKEEKIIDFIIVSGLSSLIFARVVFLLEHLGSGELSLERAVLFIRYPGLSFWGGLIGIFLVLVWFAKENKWDFWKIGDEIVLGLLPFLSLAQLGSFFDGSGQGKVTGMPWGIYFPGSFLRRQPLSLFFGIFLLLIWLVLLQVERKWRFWEWYKSKADGFIALAFTQAIFFSNLLLAFLREAKLYFYWLEISLSMAGFVLANLVFYYRSGRLVRRGKIND